MQISDGAIVLSQHVNMERNWPRGSKSTREMGIQRCRRVQINLAIRMGQRARHSVLLGTLPPSRELQPLADPADSLRKLSRLFPHAKQQPSSLQRPRSWNTLSRLPWLIPRALSAHAVSTRCPWIWHNATDGGMAGSVSNYRVHAANHDRKHISEDLVPYTCPFAWVPRLLCSATRH